eukprot:6731147-Ditylum_brightwellii.AAC.1
MVAVKADLCLKMAAPHRMHQFINPTPAGTTIDSYPTKEPHVPPLINLIAIVFNIHANMSICPKSKNASLFSVITSRFPNTVLEEWDKCNRNQSITTGEDIPWFKDSLEIYAPYERQNNRLTAQ